MPNITFTIQQNIAELEYFHLNYKISNENDWRKPIKMLKMSEDKMLKMSEDLWSTTLQLEIGHHYYYKYSIEKKDKQRWWEGDETTKDQKIEHKMDEREYFCADHKDYIIKDLLSKKSFLFYTLFPSRNQAKITINGKQDAIDKIIYNEAGKPISIKNVNTKCAVKYEYEIKIDDTHTEKIEVSKKPKIELQYYCFHDYFPCKLGAYDLYFSDTGMKKFIANYMKNKVKLVIYQSKNNKPFPKCYECDNTSPIQYIRIDPSELESVPCILESFVRSKWSVWLCLKSMNKVLEIVHTFLMCYEGITISEAQMFTNFSMGMDERRKEGMEEKSN